MWREREPKYRAAADITIDNNTPLADSLRRLEEALALLKEG